MKSQSFRKQGFSLTELLIVIVIISVLMLIAVPNYQAYVKRSRVAEAISMMDSYKADVMQYFEYKRGLPCCGAGTGVANVGPATINNPSATLAQIRWYGSTSGALGNGTVGEVEATFTPAFSASLGVTSSAVVFLQGQVINNKVVWLCGPHPDPSKGLPAKLLPASCRVTTSDPIPMVMPS